MAEEMPETYRSSGKKFSRHGRVFQLKLLILFLNRGCKKGYKFSLATEIECAKAFDDVLFKYKDENDDTKYRFVQVKHKLEEVGTEIKYRDLLGNTREQKKGDFHLLKYFESFLEIKANGKPGGTFDNLKLNDLIIYTNTGIDFDELTRNAIKLKKRNDKDDILDDEPIGKKKPERYRFVSIPDVEKDIFYGSTDINHQMAKELAKRVCNGTDINLKNDNFQKFHKALVMEHILDVTTRKLHEDFVQLKELTENAEEFRRTFILEGMKQSKTTQEEFLKEIQSKELNLCKVFGRSEEQLDEKLPTDRVNNHIINEYLELLTLAVNQPNSEQLDEIIKKEIREDFKIHDSGLITEAFYYYMWEWMTETHGRFLSNKDLQHFYERAKKRLKKLNIIGVRSTNSEKNLNFGEFFENVSAMEMNLNCTEPIVNIIAPKSTTLAFIKVVQVLENCPIDSFAAVDANFLLSNEKKYLEAFDFEEPFTMVVEWSTICNDKENEINKLLKNILGKIKPEHEQKLVLISSSVKLDENWKECSSQKLTFKNDIIASTEFCDLTRKAQSRIMSRTVILQDRKCILNDLLNGGTHCLTEEIVDIILNEENLVMGKRVNDLHEIESNYTERKFTNYLTYTTEWLIAESKKDVQVFAIIGTSKNELLKLMPNEKICNFGDKDFAVKLSRIIVVQNLLQIMQLCQYYQPHTNVHLLEKVGNCFKMVGSSGVQAVTDPYSEDQLLHAKGKIIAIAADRGTGQSTLFKHLATSLLNNSNYWVLLINLKNFINILKDSEFSNHDSIIKFIIETQELQDIFQKDLLRAHILVSGKIVLFFDGFDDCQQYESKIVSMLKYLVTTKIKTIYVSSRMHLAEKFECEPSLQTYAMLPFSAQDYAILLKKIWKRNLQLNDEIVVENRLDSFVTSLVTSFAEKTSSLTSILLQIPLHAEMIANVYKEKLEEHLKCDNPKMQFDIQIIAGPTMVQPLIPVGRWRCKTGFDLLELYRAFIKNKIEMSLRGKMQLEEKTVRYIFEATISPYILKMHENLAICMLFSEEVQTIFKATKVLPNIALEDVGLTQRLGEEYTFIHPTFAHYFAAQRIDKLLRKYDKATEKYKLITEILTSNLFLESNTMIRKFLDSMLAHDSEIHFAVLNRNTDHFNEIVSRNPDEIHSCDALGRTPLHYVCMTNAMDIGNYIIAKNESCVSDLDVFQFGPIWYASLYLPNQMFELLLKVGSNVNGFENSLKTLLCIFNNLSDPNKQTLAEYISIFADNKQKAIIVNFINYKCSFMDTMKKSNYKGFPLFFIFACKEQQQEMLIQNDYKIIKTILKRNPAELWTFLNNCIDDKLKDNICQLEEYETKFHSLMKSDLNQLWFLVKMANRKQLENLWGKKGYVKYFIQCAKSMRSDMMYELMQLFKGENLFISLGPSGFFDYFKRLLSEKQFYWAGKLFECTNANQRKQLLKPDLWFWELNNALETNDCNAFNCLLNCVTKKPKREKMLRHISYVKVFKIAVSEYDLKRLITLSFCNDDECVELTQSLEEEDYYRIFVNKLGDVQSLLLLAHYTNSKERVEVFSLAQCSNDVQETVENRGPLCIDKFDKHDKQLLEALRPDAIIQEINEKKWSIWGRLLYVLCKHIKIPPVLVKMSINVNFAYATENQEVNE